MSIFSYINHAGFTNAVATNTGVRGKIRGDAAGMK
jgi:hypothetical protein